MRFKKAVVLILAAFLFCAPLIADDTTETWMGSESGADDIYSPNSKKSDMSFLQPLELAGMGLGTYLACRSDLMSNAMTSFEEKTDLWSIISNSGVVLLTVFAGTVLGGVATAVAFGPMDLEYEGIKDKGFSEGTRTTMIISGALLMGAGGYIGYLVGNESPQQYGEEIIIGALAGAIVGSYLGEQLGNLIFGAPKKTKDRY